MDRNVAVTRGNKVRDDAAAGLAPEIRPGTTRLLLPDTAGGFVNKEEKLDSPLSVFAATRNRESLTIMISSTVQSCWIISSIARLYIL